jgi:hypothetical protein
MITRRCTQRQMLLRPDDETTNAFTYCLALAAQRYQMDVVLTMAEGNHHHTVIFDRHGNHPAFVEHFHKLLARSQNVLRGRRENFWAAEEVCITRLVDPATVIDKLVYAATNPVKDGLVERVHHWPGCNGYKALVARRPLTARRPLHFFRKTMPATVTLSLVIPPELGNEREVIDEVRARVKAFEKTAAAERRRTGARVLGRRRARTQPWNEIPNSEEPRRTLRPRFAGALGPRVAALISYREFLADYREARAQWLMDRSAVFPHGTYWLARFAAVATAPPV